MCDEPGEREGYVCVRREPSCDEAADAKGQETRYTYDGYGRLAETQIGRERRWRKQVGQRVTYYYDSNPLDGNYSANAWGRLAAVGFAGNTTRICTATTRRAG